MERKQRRNVYADTEGGTERTWKRPLNCTKRMTQKMTQKRTQKMEQKRTYTRIQKWTRNIEYWRTRKHFILSADGQSLTHQMGELGLGIYNPRSYLQVVQDHGYHAGEKRQ